MSRYEEYVTRCCRTGRCTPDQAREQAVSKEVQAYYESENQQQNAIHHEFTCLSEN